MILTPPLAAYPYVQYNDDDDISAWFIAYNTLVQGDYIDYFNTYNLADYNSSLIGGDLLDWIALGIYGMERPFLVTGHSSTSRGPYGTDPYGTRAYGTRLGVAPTPITYAKVSDDVFRRVLTWNFFKGDGPFFNVEFLKRRVTRFLTGTLYPDNEYNISIVFSGTNSVAINVPTANSLSATLQALVQSNIINLPFQYAFTVNLV